MQKSTTTLPTEAWIAWRYLRARRAHGFISLIAIFSLIGIALGVATLIIAMSAMNGFRHDLLTRILGINGEIAVYSATGPSIENYNQLVEQIRDMKIAKSVFALTEAQGLMMARGRATGVMVQGIAPGDFNQRSILAGTINQDALAPFNGKSIIIGARMARDLGVAIGDSLAIISPNGLSTVFGSLPKKQNFTVVAVFSLGMVEYDSSYIFMPIDTAQSFFALGPTASRIEVFAHDYESADDVLQKIATSLPPGYHLENTQSRNQGFFNAIQSLNSLIFIILSLIILVAAFNIISSLVMLVKDKNSAIAILRTMGVTQPSILRIFLMIGMMIGLVGTIFGVILGLIITVNFVGLQNFIDRMMGGKLSDHAIFILDVITTKINPWQILGVIIMALGLSFLATIYPAWRAARIDPIEALRYE